MASDNTQRLEHLEAPTFVVWATQDDIFSRDIEQKVIDTLTVAAENGGSFWWKQYGVLPPPADGSQTDFGHNVVWEAPNALALDIASFLITGRPTNILFQSNYPADINRVVTEPVRRSSFTRPAIRARRPHGRKNRSYRNPARGRRVAPGAAPSADVRGGSPMKRPAKVCGDPPVFALCSRGLSATSTTHLASGASGRPCGRPRYSRFGSTTADKLGEPFARMRPRDDQEVP